MKDEGHTVDAICLDFARQRLTKFKSFGLGDFGVRWIEAYLTGRVSRVHVEERTLLFVDDVNMVTRRAQNISNQRLLITAWSW